MNNTNVKLSSAGRHMTSLKEPNPPAVPPTVTKDVLLLRLGARMRTGGVLVDSGPPLRRLVGVRECNARGTPLVYAPHSHRSHAEHVPRWVQHCRSVIRKRRSRSIREEREQLYIAMGFFTLIVLRRWRKWTGREAILRRFFDKLSVGDALNRWKRASRLAAFQALLERLVLREAVHRWGRRLERQVAFESAIRHFSRSLMTKVWKVWVTSRSNTEPNCYRLRRSMERWRAWQQRRKMRVDAFHQFIVRRVLASSVDRWRRETSYNRCRRRQEALGHLLGSLMLRKCFVALVDEAHHSATLRRLLERYRKVNLHDLFEAWRRWFSESRQAQKTLKGEPIALAPDSETYLTTIRQPGKPRKGHCRCVYAVSRRERCTCAPRTHLLRRVEELHRLVAKGLNRCNGGHRLLSHVVQKASAPSAVGGSFRSTGTHLLSQTFSADPLGIVTPSACNMGGAPTHVTDSRRRVARAGSNGSQQPQTRERGAVPTSAAVKEDGRSELGAGSGICLSPVVSDRSRCAERGIGRASPCRRYSAPSQRNGMTHW